MAEDDPTIRRSRWFYRHPNLARGSLSLTTAILVLGIGEVGLRLAGQVPGYVSRHQANFARVDQVVDLGKFVAGEDGIFRANPEYDWAADTEINADGFRSVAFEPPEDGQRSVLFLGDSFTWGASATPLTRSFVDLIAKDGLVCFNAGMPGTSPPQYAAVAEKYVPKVRPDVVAVVVYLGNDINEDYVPLLPGHPPWFVTNAGWLRAFDQDNQPLETPQQAYDYYLDLSNKVGSEDRGGLLNALRALSTSTAVGTLVWVSLAERNPRFHVDHAESGEERSKRKLSRALATRDCLERIRTTAAAAGAAFRLFLIPVRPSLQTAKNRIEGNILIFQGFDAEVPADMNEDDYATPPDLHFNNQGHRRFADFVRRHLP